MLKIKIVLLSLLLTGLFSPFVVHAASCNFTAQNYPGSDTAFGVQVAGASVHTLTVLQNSQTLIPSYTIIGSAEQAVLVSTFDNFDKTKDFTVLVSSATEQCDPVGGVTLSALTAATPPPPPTTPPSGGPPPLPISNSVQTALGNIPTDPVGFISAILDIALGLAGGVAFLLVVYGGIRILTSTGDPEAVNQGREIVTSALVGLLFIIFAIFLLNFLGHTILGFFT